MSQTIKNIGFTGTQIGMTEKQKEKVRELLQKFKTEGAISFHHGDCIGSDAEAK